MERRQRGRERRERAREPERTRKTRIAARRRTSPIAWKATYATIPTSNVFVPRSCPVGVAISRKETNSKTNERTKQEVTFIENTHCITRRSRGRAKGPGDPLLVRDSFGLLPPFLIFVFSLLAILRQLNSDARTERDLVRRFFRRTEDGQRVLTGNVRREWRSRSSNVVRISPSVNLSLPSFLFYVRSPPLSRYLAPALD